MEFQVLFTGSEGNCSLLTDNETTILIDAGFRTKKKMEEIVLPILEKYKKIDGIIITHEHNDHFSPWTGRLSMDYNIPLYLHERHYEDEENRKTKYLSHEDKKAGTFREVEKTNIKEDEEFTIGTFKIKPFTAYHDAKKTLGFVINNNFGYLADCGFISNNIKKNLIEVTTLALEFNYEIDLLLESDRHWSNKLRTLGKFGHLSNEEAEKFCKWLKKNGKLQKVITLHPSNAHTDYEKLEERLKRLEIEYHLSQREGNEIVGVI